MRFFSFTFIHHGAACLRMLFCGFILAALAVVPARAEMPSPRLLVISKLLQQRLTSPDGKNHETGLYTTELHDFYLLRNYMPVWVDQHGPLPKAETLSHVLLNAGKEGLVADLYHTNLIASLRDARSAAGQAELELVLTDAFFHYSRDVQTGYQHTRLDNFYQAIVPPEINPVDELNRILQANDFQAAIDDLAPKHPGYQRLRGALARYREIQQNGGWPALPDGPLLQRGDNHAYLIILRKRLAAEGDLLTGPVNHDNDFDDAVKFAVERFQVRHGLKVDGVVGPATRAAMNVPVQERIEQIMLNMERWRWLPKDMGQRYVMVNTADFRLEAVNDGVVEFAMDVIIGKPERPTPVLQGRFHTVVINPYWTVPPTIAFEDLLPLQRRNPSYLKSKGIRVLRRDEELDPALINWQRVNRDYFPFILRQDPGPKNPLGQLKFLFSNPFDVYLHGTPDQHLFYRNVRALSSGCVRVKDPTRLADYILAGQGDWDEERLIASIHTDDRLEIPVNNRTPVYLVYLTTWVGEHDGVHFRPDIYEWDPKTPKCDVSP